MNNINMDLQLFDKFITESENHLNMIREHYSNLSKGYLTESVEYQLIQESQESTFKEKIKKIIEAIRKWIVGIIEKAKKKFGNTKKRTEASIDKLKKSESDDAGEGKYTFTHSKFDMSKFDNIKIVDIISTFLEKLTGMIQSTEMYSLNHMDISDLSTNCNKDMMNSIGGGHNFYFRKSHTVSLFIDREAQITKSYTKDEVLALSEKSKNLHDPLNDMNDELKNVYDKFLTLINEKIKSNPVTKGTSIYQYILTQTTSTMATAYKIVDDILDAYILCDNIVFGMANRIVGKNTSKQESFQPPFDVSFESLLESINPTRIKLLDLN